MYTEAFLFGVTVAIAIGPIALLIINTSVTRGLLAGLSCGMGAALADLCFALVAFHAGGTVIEVLANHRYLVSVSGNLLLAMLGLAMMANTLRSRDAANASPGFRVGLAGTWLLTIVNPFAITMFIAWISRFPGSSDFTTRNLLAVAVFAGSLLVQSGLAAGGLLLRPVFAHRRVLVACNLLSGAGIVAFGLIGVLRIR